MCYGRCSDFRHTSDIKISGHRIFLTLRKNSTKVSGYQDISRSFKDQFYQCLSSSKPKTDFCHCGFSSHLLLVLAQLLCTSWESESERSRIVENIKSTSVTVSAATCYLRWPASWYWWRHTRHRHSHRQQIGKCTQRNFWQRWDFKESLCYRNQY